MQLQQRSAPFKNPLCVALDVDSEAEAFRLAENLSDIAGGFKVGPRLLNRYGEKFIQRLASISPVFVDCKFFDIPSTMESSIVAAFESGASAVTVHALCGSTALRQLAQLEVKLNSERPFKILAVTILTSWTESDFAPVFKGADAKTNVTQLVEYSSSFGIKNFVCSPEELPLVRGPERYLVTPGIRFIGSDLGDQSRIAEPKKAFEAGANLLVVGRPIIKAVNPREAAADYLAELV